jgi:hypothetical protein
MYGSYTRPTSASRTRDQSRWYGPHDNDLSEAYIETRTISLVKNTARQTRSVQFSLLHMLNSVAVDH